MMNPFQKVFNLLDLDILEESGRPKCSVVKIPSANVGDMGLIPGLGRSPGKGNGNSVQYSCLENSRTEEPGRLLSMGSQKSQTQLSD